MKIEDLKKAVFLNKLIGKPTIVSSWESKFLVSDIGDNFVKIHTILQSRHFPVANKVEIAVLSKYEILGSKIVEIFEIVNNMDGEITIEFVNKLDTHLSNTSYGKKVQ